MIAQHLIGRLFLKRPQAMEKERHPALCPERTGYEKYERIDFPRILSSEEVYTKEYLIIANKTCSQIYRNLPACPKQRTKDAKRCLKGIILGDMYGAPFEFARGVMPESSISDVSLQEPGKWTDDSAMTIASLRAAKEYKSKRIPDKQAIELFKTRYREMAHQYPNLGYGGHFYNWAVFDMDSQRYISYGNGSAMRAGILGAASDDLKTCIRLSYLSALPTHAHPEGIKGAVCTAVLTYYACHGADKKTLLEATKVFYPHGARRPEDAEDYSFGYFAPDLQEDEIRALYPKTLSVTCMETVPLAISIVLLSGTYLDFLKYLSVIPMDSDTVGAIGGGIMAALDDTDLSAIPVRFRDAKNQPKEIIDLFTL